MLYETVFVSCFFLTVTGSSIGGRIVNGTAASIQEVPFLVSLRAVDKHSCGATILNEYFILTAAHCVFYAEKYFTVEYGVSRITNGANVPNVLKISKKIQHEKYSAGNGYQNDVAIVKLEKPLKFGPNVQPVKLPQPNAPTPAGAVALLVGWGDLYTGGPSSADLQKVNINIYSDAECVRIHAETGPTNKTNHICAGIPEGGKGQCSGDSGGPLLVNGVQVGIVSWSVKPCTAKGFPGVFTNVANYVNWINEKVAQNS